MGGTNGASEGIDVARAMRLALGNLARLQAEDGAWPGEYGGPMFLLPMYIALCRATGKIEALGETRRARIVAHFFAVQNADGSIGLHAEDRRGSMFTSALVYVSLRALGVAPDEPRVARLRQWIHAHGTPLGAASWGKLTLCLLHLYEWDGIHPVLPELWLLPASAPMHPGRLWCHCRQVYLPMAWLYGTKSRVAVDEWTRAVRDELYDGAWSSLDWKKQRSTISPADAYRKDSPLLATANRAMGRYEERHSTRVRKRALASVLEHVRYEDEVTGFLDIGPVNKVLNAFVHAFRAEAGGAGNESAPEDFRRAFAACDDYLWDAEDGTTKMQGYNNSKLWDTAFATQAILAARAVDVDSEETATTTEPMLARAHDYLRDNQILDDVPQATRYFRHASRGGWPFSTRAHGWPITDCTSEGLKCALALESERFEPAIPTPLLVDSVRLILSWQNEDGGWATYEKQRGGAWLEMLNPSQVFGDIMVDYSYVECTSACLQALHAARPRHIGDAALAAEIDRAIARGASYIRTQQRKDGSFEGKWAVCFTYGTWFAISGLLAAGAARSDPAIARACAFLVGKQQADGGWGEHGDSCRTGRYLQAERSGVAQTSWALSALVRAGHPSHAAQKRAADLLVARQESDGSWAKEPLVGVFNRTCLIDYDNYRHYFPLWALAEWSASSRQV
jgi:squalene/oxidosqualene cyclase-like protein